MKTMRARLLDLMLRQWVTPIDAWRKVRCLSLSQRCGEFRTARKWADITRRAERPPLIIDKWVRLPSGTRVKAFRAIK
jgi:hypothetical protein